MIRLKNIDKNYYLGKTRIQAIKNIDLTIDKGEFITIMGPSGSGKTTLLNIIGCLDKPDTGEVWIDNKNIVSMTNNQLSDIRAAKIGFIFQSFNLIPILNVFENIELPLMNNHIAFSKKEKEINCWRTVLYDLLESHAGISVRMFLVYLTY